MRPGPLPHEVRARIAGAVAAQSQTFTTLSRVLKRSDGYVSRFIRDEVPYKLLDADQRRLARFLGLDETTLLRRPPPQRRSRFAT